MFCPMERNALKEFYDSAKGAEWTNSTNWMKPHIAHCQWYGIECDDANITVERLKLPSNGLSGTLTPHISNLSSLKVLNLADNNIKVRHVTVQAIRVFQLQARLHLILSVCAILVFIRPGLDSHRDKQTLQSHSSQIELQCVHWEWSRFGFSSATAAYPLAWQ